MPDCDFLHTPSAGVEGRFEAHNYSAGASLDGHPWALLASSTLISPLIQGSRRYMKVRKLSLAAMSAALILAACAGAPVQEMSDARQAVAVAEQTLAGKPASPDLISAHRYLQAAQAALDSGDYSTAREDARLARQLALRALGIAQPTDISGHPSR